MTAATMSAAFAGAAGGGTAAPPPEPLLDENADRYCMFPVKQDRVWDEYKKAETVFWTAEDVDFSRDPADWQQRLAPGERSFLSSALGYLAASGRLLAEGVGCRFLQEVELPEARAFFSFQLFKQNVAAEAVSAAVEVLFGGRQEQVAAVMGAVRALPAMQQKIQWAKARVHGGASFAERLVAAAAMSSVLHAGTFVGLYSFKRRGLLPGLGQATDLISRDEGINVEAAGVMYSLLNSRLSDGDAQTVVREAVALERAFVCDQLPLAATGLEAGAVGEYLEFVGDGLLAALGHAPAFGRKANPLPWLEVIAAKAADVKVAAARESATGMSSAGALKVSVGGAGGPLVFDEDF